MPTCSGVPVRRRRLQLFSSARVLSSRISRQFMFLSRWPSSMIRNFQSILRILAMSRMIISYEVILRRNGTRTNGQHGMAGPKAP